MEVEKRSSKGGFLQLFDWNVKSRKKLFSNKPDLPESSKQGKENLDNLTISRLHQMKLHETIHGPSLSENDWASSMNNDEGITTKAPGVVARLMGLDSLPTLDTSEPNFTPFIDSHSFRHPRITAEFENEHFSDYGMRNKLDGFTRNPVEDRLRKLQNRPIERFQTEVLPPRSAKSVPITHHRMLSPIKSPGFILSRNAAYIMEAASKIIEQSPQSTSVNARLPSIGSPSVPLRIRDLKEKMEAVHRTSRFQETSQRLKSQSPVNPPKPQPRDNLKQKNKSVSLSTPSKTNVQKPEGTTSRNRSMMKQKEDDRKQRNTPKRVQNRSTTNRTSEVLTPNNQKQNCAAVKDRSNLKPRVPCQQDRKPTVSTREVKTLKKTSENSGVRNGKELSSSKTKNISGKKRPTEGSNSNNVMIKEKERSVKCNITIDGSSNWESVDRKNGMDVVSFTFTSPIKKPVSETEACGQNQSQTSVKSRALFQDDDQSPSFGTPVIDSDALSVLLEQKLKELSSLVETSTCSPGTDVASSSSIHKGKNIIQHDSDVVNTKPEWKEIEVSDCNSNTETEESGIKASDDSWMSNSTTTLTSNGNTLYMSARNTELEDSATSLLNDIFEFTSMSRFSSDWESEYIKEVISYAKLVLEDYPMRKVINPDLFNQLETQNKKVDPFLRPQRRALFECVSVCLESRRERAFSGSYSEWVKWSAMFEKKDLLLDDVQKEISGWTNMEEMEADVIVDKDMSSRDGKWLGFDGEVLEEGMVVENEILTDLIDQIVADFLS